MIKIRWKEAKPNNKPENSDLYNNQHGGVGDLHIWINKVFRGDLEHMRDVRSFQTSSQN